MFFLIILLIDLWPWLGDVERFGETDSDCFWAAADSLVVEVEVVSVVAVVWFDVGNSSVVDVWFVGTWGELGEVGSSKAGLGLAISSVRSARTTLSDCCLRLFRVKLVSLFVVLLPVARLFFELRWLLPVMFVIDGGFCDDDELAGDLRALKLNERLVRIRNRVATLWPSSFSSPASPASTSLTMK